MSAENWRGTVHGMRFDLRIAGKTYDVALPLPGPHFLLNFLAAAAAAHHVGVSPEQIAEAATSIKAAKSRGQVVRLNRGVTLLDDCYNSNPAAVDAAVTALGMAAQGPARGLPGRHAGAGADGARPPPRDGRQDGRPRRRGGGRGRLGRLSPKGRGRRASPRPTSSRTPTAAAAAAEPWCGPATPCW